MKENAPADLSQEEQQAKRLDLLRRWDGAGQGHLPLPESAESYASLPLSVRMGVEAHDPELARNLAPIVPLPAATELRLASGIDSLEPVDVEPLLAAGHHEIVAQLRNRYLEGLQATHEANQVAEAKAREEWLAGAEDRRRASEEQANAKFRQNYISRVQQGLPPAPPTAPAIPAILRS